MCGCVTVCWGGRWRAGGQGSSRWGGDLQQSFRAFHLHGQPGSTRFRKSENDKNDASISHFTDVLIQQRGHDCTFGSHH